MQILKGLRSCYEEHHNVNISDEAIEAAVDLSSRYISDRFLPDKAIDLMDEACSRKRLGFGDKTGRNKALQLEMDALSNDLESALSSGNIAAASEILESQNQIEKELGKSGTARKITVHESDIADVVSVWTKIPVSKLTEKESKKLSRLEQELHSVSLVRMKLLLLLQEQSREAG